MALADAKAHIDTIKRKVTAAMTQIREQERQFMEMERLKAKSRNPYAVKEVNPPHLLDVQYVIDNVVPVWVTIEPNPNMPLDEGIQGWDDTRERVVNLKWHDIWDCGLNPRPYYPVGKQEWDLRLHDTAMQHVEENEVRQSIGKYR